MDETISLANMSVLKLVDNSFWNHLSTVRASSTALCPVHRLQPVSPRWNGIHSYRNPRYR